MYRTTLADANQGPRVDNPTGTENIIQRSLVYPLLSEWPIGTTNARGVRGTQGWTVKYVNKRTSKEKIDQPSRRGVCPLRSHELRSIQGGLPWFLPINYPLRIALTFLHTQGAGDANARVQTLWHVNNSMRTNTYKSLYTTYF